MNAAQRVLRARIGAYSLHSQRSAGETTAKARAAFLARFEEQVDPLGQLAPDERFRRALAARRAYFTRLALRSGQARREPARASTAPAGVEVHRGSGKPHSV